MKKNFILMIIFCAAINSMDHRDGHGGAGIGYNNQSSVSTININGKLAGYIKNEINTDDELSTTHERTLYSRDWKAIAQLLTTNKDAHDNVPEIIEIAYFTDKAADKDLVQQLIRQLGFKQDAAVKQKKFNGSKFKYKLSQ